MPAIKLKAATLIELVVVLIIGSIVMGICYFAYIFINKQVKDYKQINTELNKVLVLNTVLQSDIYDCKYLIKNANSELTFVFENEKKRKYQFQLDKVIRTDNVVNDTFFVETKNWNFYLMEKEVDNGIIDELSLNVNVLDSSKKMHFIKEYNANLLLTVTNKLLQ